MPVLKENTDIPTMYQTFKGFANHNLQKVDITYDINDGKKVSLLMERSIEIYACDLQPLSLVKWHKSTVQNMFLSV